MPNKNTIPEFLSNRAKNVLRSAAFSFPEHNQHCTWQQLWLEVRAVSKGLLHLGIKKGDRVAVLMESRIELIVSLFAAATVGAVAVPLNTYSKPEELKLLFLDAAPALFIIGSSPQRPLSILPRILYVAT